MIRWIRTDGAVVGAISGLIGGIIIALLYIIGFGAINTILGSISAKLGIIAGSIVAGLVIINIFSNNKFSTRYYWRSHWSCYQEIIPKIKI